LLIWPADCQSLAIALLLEAVERLAELLGFISQDVAGMLADLLVVAS